MSAPPDGMPEPPAGFAEALALAGKVKAADPSVVRRRKRWEAAPLHAQRSLLPRGPPDAERLRELRRDEGADAEAARLEEAARLRAQGNKAFQAAAAAAAASEDAGAGALLREAASSYEAGAGLFRWMERAAGEGGEQGEIEDGEAAGAGSEEALAERALLLSNLAAVYLRQGEHRGAAEACREAERLRPNGLKATYRWAQACLAMGDLEEASAHLGRALELPEAQGAVRARLRALAAQVRAEVRREREAMGGKLAGGAGLYDDKADKGEDGGAAAQRERFVRELSKAGGRGDSPAAVLEMEAAARRFGIDLGDPLVQQELARLANGGDGGGGENDKISRGQGQARRRGWCDLLLSPWALGAAAAVLFVAVRVGPSLSWFG